MAKITPKPLDEPSENPDSESAGQTFSPQSETAPILRAPQSKVETPTPISIMPLRASSEGIIPVGVGGVWHSHKNQGMQTTSASVVVPGQTFAMLIPTSEFTCHVLIRTDLRDASGMATSIATVEMGSEDAMKFLETNFIQTRFQQRA